MLFAELKILEHSLSLNEWNSHGPIHPKGSRPHHTRNPCGDAHPPELLKPITRKTDPTVQGSGLTPVSKTSRERRSISGKSEIRNSDTFRIKRHSGLDVAKRMPLVSEICGLKLPIKAERINGFNVNLAPHNAIYGAIEEPLKFPAGEPPDIQREIRLPEASIKHPVQTDL